MIYNNKAKKAINLYPQAFGKETIDERLLGEITERFSKLETEVTTRLPLWVEQKYPGVIQDILNQNKFYGKLMLCAPYLNQKYCSDNRYGEEVTYKTLRFSKFSRWIYLLSALDDERKIISTCTSYLLSISIAKAKENLVFCTDKTDAEESISSILLDKKILISGESKTDAHEGSYWRKRGLVYRFGYKNANFQRGMPFEIEEAIADSDFVFFTAEKEEILLGKNETISKLIYTYGKFILQVAENIFVAMPHRELRDLSQYPFVRARFNIHSLERYDNYSNFCYCGSLNIPMIETGDLVRVPALFMEYY